MAKSSPLQPSFSGGEFSPRVKGRVDSERYKNALDKCLNYLPSTQGPLYRRPGAKYAGSNVKDPSKPPAFLEFKFNQLQNYVLEFGDFYVRFYTNHGQITTTSTHFKVAGDCGTVNLSYASSAFYAMRTNPYQKPGETLLTSSVITASSILEIQTPYSYLDTPKLKYAQKDDTLYLVCSSYPEYKLSRFGNEEWDLRKVNNLDGPYLPLNSYRSLGDAIRVELITLLNVVAVYQDLSVTYTAHTGPVRPISNITSASGLIRVTSSAHQLFNGDKVVIRDVVGTTEANNGTSTIAGMCWTVLFVDSNTFDLANSTFSNVYVGSGKIYPALFEPYRTAGEFSDTGRNVSVVKSSDGKKAFGVITKVHHMHLFDYHIDSNYSTPLGAGGSTVHEFWYLGLWSRSNGYPDAIAFHQDRKFLSGTPQFPQQIDGSVVGEYENFSPSNSSSVVVDANAIQRTLASSQKNPVHWLKSDANGLLAGTTANEWKITPSSQGAALTPSNFNAAPTGGFGSHNADAVEAGNTVLYIQKAQRRIRELNFFYQVDTYRSTDLAELSDHLTVPGITRLSVQTEPLAVIWALKSNGQLVSMVYGRDDQSLKVGWAQHTLGGSSDSAKTAPVIKSITTIPSPDGLHDELWMAVQRYINGTSVVTVEYMTDIFEDGDKQEDSFYVDCGGTYDNPVNISGISTAAQAQVTCGTSHLLANGDTVTLRGVTGLNSTFIDTNEIEFTSSLVNYRYFEVASATASAFFLKDYGGSEVSSLGYSAYFSGGTVRKLVSTISGATWLKNETVHVLADGKVHGPVTVNSAGVFTLNYPAATVQFGYRYNSDARTLRPDSGSQDGTSIGKKRRAGIAALMLHNVGELKLGPSFDRLTPLTEIDNFRADFANADTAVPLFSGIARDNLASQHDYDGQICFRQSDPLPGMIQTLTVVLETNDV